MKKLFIILVLVCSLPCIALADLDIGSLLNLAHAILSVTPPTPSPEPSPTPAPEDKELYRSPEEFSGAVLRKIYAEFDYERAMNSPSLYKDTSVCTSGWIFMKKIFEDGWAYAMIFDQDSHAIYVLLPPEAFLESDLETGNVIEVFGVTDGKTETNPEYPIIMATLRIVNHGEK